MKPTLLLMAMLALLSTAACDSEEVKVQKSPCVGADDSPCGPKRTPEYNV